ncbi:probable E3 ubiquitin-protein ligase BAH1-like isoform X2 [Prosopis cineraria]|uniref:probable E3 ubiquitin-protein ligase BAH1-like isoform X2 n=1 Tax=Prosopis cineraria TaxID=364024 RepID=UPI002410850F|nr:probable E3 ubiquitin-protein ligase BAH1-like isoform X2 [Prosopis cineraria]
MKFGEAFTEYLLGEREWMLDKKCVHIEYKRLKKVLKSCQSCTRLQSSSCSEFLENQLCQCQACPLCDQMFFSELIKEASDIAKYFNSRVRRLLHLHVATGIQRYVVRLRKCFKNDQQALAQEGRVLIEYIAMNAIALRKILKKYDKVHSSVKGENFKSRMHAERIELLHSPWLIELGAFYLNSDQSDAGELNGVYGHFSCNLNVTEAAMTLVLPDSTRLEYDLTCAVCLSCACSAASLMIFQGLKAASPESKCPICREVGVYSKAVHMLELDLLLKTRCKEYWKERLADERVLMLKQSKEHWKSQSTYAI